MPSIPSVMTTAEGNTGTATTQRTINAANLKIDYFKSFTSRFKTSKRCEFWAKASTKPSYTAAEVGAATASHTHDDRYYTETEMDTLLSGKAASSHSHTWTQVPGVSGISVIGKSTAGGGSVRI